MGQTEQLQYASMDVTIGYESDDCSEYERSLTILIVFICLPWFLSISIHWFGLTKNQEIAPTWKYPERRQVPGLNYCFWYKGSLPRSQWNSPNGEGSLICYSTSSPSRTLSRECIQAIIPWNWSKYMLPHMGYDTWYPSFIDMRLKDQKNTCSFTSASVLQSQPHFWSLLPIVQHGAKHQDGTKRRRKRENARGMASQIYLVVQLGGLESN